jgi:hypothetical protein
MSLEALYNNAAPNTYVGNVRTQQAEEVGARAAQSFMDGNKRNKFNGTIINAGVDAYQKEFTRNNAGDFAVGGAQAPSRPANGLTRWTSRAFELAFGNKGPLPLPNGYYVSSFRTAKSSKGVVGTVHNYIPSAVYSQSTTGGYINLSTFARARYNSPATSR